MHCQPPVGARQANKHANPPAMHVAYDAHVGACQERRHPRCAALEEAKGPEIGVMITASHDPATDDNSEYAECFGGMGIF